MTDIPSAPPSKTAWDVRSQGALSSARAAASRATPRRGPADPVRALMHRHRELCERAVDPLEIAAGLEAHGVTDRTAARFRHRDVFSLAEELYARVPRDAETPCPTRELTRPPAGWALIALLPGAVCAVAVAGVRLTGGQIRPAAALLAALAVVAALTIALRRGPLRAGPRTGPAVRLCTAWLVAYAICGDGLLGEAVRGGPDGAWALDPAAATGLAFAVAPAVWCAHLFSVRARRKLASSRGLAEFAGRSRPLLMVSAALFLCGLAACPGGCPTRLRNRSVGACRRARRAAVDCSSARRARLRPGRRARCWPRPAAPNCSRSPPCSRPGSPAAGSSAAP